MSALSVEEVGDRVRPVTLAGRRVVPVLDPLASLFPDGGLQRGTTLSVVASPSGGGTSLALALVAAASQAGLWAAAVGPWSADLGLVAAAELGVHLERFALVPEPAGQAAAVLAALLDALDVVVAGVPVRPADARRLAARARERGAVLIALGDVWPERTDLRLVATAMPWQGLHQGCGHLRARQVEVASAGRGAASRRRAVRVWLPADHGGIQPVDPARQPAPSVATAG